MAAVSTAPKANAGEAESEEIEDDADAEGEEDTALTEQTADEPS